MNGYHLDTGRLEETVREWGSLKSLIDAGTPGAGNDFSMALITYRTPHHSGRHDDHEAILILEGRGEAAIGGERVAFRPGSLLLIPPGTDHGIEEVAGGPVRGVLVHFRERRG